MPDLGPWVARQRAGRQVGNLTGDRVRILESIGLDFGDEAQMTGEWEERFDQLVEWLLWQARRATDAGMAQHEVRVFRGMHVVSAALLQTLY